MKNMHSLESRLRATLFSHIPLIEARRKHQHMDWSVFRRIMDELIPVIADIFREFLEERDSTIQDLERSNRKLKAKLNQVAFRSDPGRDKKILELYEQGLSRGKIAKEVGMSKWGVSKALKRLGAN